ncbi:MAG: thioredoxin family protein [Rhodospirillales bacterium]|nr:thioredoxin family protein [Rhodospirillales bacterium]MCW8863116.1 thioredoxin family protein [Rhodospirillales bacterium]MCW8951209.1 thioredoxin family protein [Rhodospirillales bacterium]MCW9001735.1 thioredoxin family protein [Rhodospirillales bacterium]
MKFNRLFCALFGALFALTSLSSQTQAAEEKIKSVMGDDGIHKQTWFIDSFLDLREDLKDAQAKGKRFAILWEQRGCPYCVETHTVNLAIPQINNYIRENFAVVQLNMWGDREVTDFDGEVTTEKKLARKWGVVFTPTINFMVEEKELKDGVSGNQQFAAVMPGYFKPFHFIRMFEFVKGRRYENQHFQKYIAEVGEQYRKEGKSFNMW